MPNGLDHDPSVGPADYGIGGAGKLVGWLLGTCFAAPTGPAGCFSIGLGITLMPLFATSLYAVVNDTYYRGRFSLWLHGDRAPGS